MIYVNLLIIILCIIFIHEFGHYSVARLFKTSVTDFSVGFGKVLYQFKDKNQTNWKISIIPLGGFVMIKGLESIFKGSKKVDNAHDSFQNLSLIKKICILLAGSAFNIISAWLCIFFIFFFFGIVNFAPIIGSVIDKSSASINDIREGDIITNVNNQDIEYFSDIADAIDGADRITIEIIRGNNLIAKEFDLTFNQEVGKYIVGIYSTNTPEIDKYALWQSLKKSLTFIPGYYASMFTYLTKSYKDKTLTQDLAGPIGVVKMADKLMLDKIKGILIIFVSISLFAGLFNLVPIPLLDGGHIVYFTLRSIFSDYLPAVVTRIYLMIGIAIISFLTLFVTLNDIFYK